MKNKKGQLDIFHQVDQEKLHEVLMDSRYIGIFWVSHGAYHKLAHGHTMQVTPMLFDYQGDNLARTFEKVHDGLKFLAIVGCNSFQIMEVAMKRHPHLQVYLPKKRVIAQRGLRKAITKYHLADSIDQPRATRTSYKVPVLITRQTGENFDSYRSLRIIAGDRLQTVLSKMKAYEQKSFRVELEFDHPPSQKDLRIIFESGQKPDDPQDSFGHIEITYEGERWWRLFAKADGHPIGVNERIFHFTENPRRMFYE
jgi:hypothetical protein